MIITKNADCTEITISDTYLNDFRTSSNGVTAVSLFYTINGGSEIEYTVLVGDITVDTITLDMGFFSQTTDTLLDGIYCFRMVVTQNTSEITKSGNILIDCGFICSLAEYVWNNPLSNLNGKYEAMKYYQLCNSCDCTTVYELYQDLMIDLDTTINQDCGC